MPEPKEPHANVKNASAVKQLKEARQSQKEDDRQRLQDLYNVLNTPEGKRVFWRLLKYCKVFESIMQANAFIYYSSGQQDVGHYILDQITEAHPEAYFEMMLEAHRKETES